MAADLTPGVWRRNPCRALYQDRTDVVPVGPIRKYHVRSCMYSYNTRTGGKGATPLRSAARLLNTVTRVGARSQQTGNHNGRVP